MVLAGGSAFGEPGKGSSAAPPVLRSQLVIAVLGLVIEKPSHGYEIARRFEGRFGLFIRASTSSIYQTLSRLARDGLIEAMPIEESYSVRRGAKPRSSYRATREGARAYRMSLVEQVRADPERFEMLGLLTFAGVNSAHAALEFLDGYEQKCMQDAILLAAPSDEAGSALDGMVGLMQRLMLDRRRRQIDADLGWIAYAKAELRELSGGIGDDLL